MTEIMLGHAPSSWSVKRLGQLFRERKEKVNDREFPPLSVTKQGIVPQLDTAAKSDDSENRKGVRAGDFVINSRSDRKGSSGLSDRDGSVSLINIVLEPCGVRPRFAHHLLRSPAFQEEFFRWGHGIVADLWTTRYSEMKNILLAIPGPDTQDAVANFLDSETARIDALIEKKERLIEISDDHWERFAFDAFSGSASPHKKITFVGHDYLPEIPSHWTLPKLKYLSPQVTVGIVVTPAAYYVSDGISAIRATNIRPMNLRSDDMVFISERGHRINSKSEIRSGDVLAVRTGQPGTACVVPDSLDGANCIDVILIRKTKKYLSELLAFFLNSNSAKAQYSKGSSGAIQQHFNVSTAGNLLVPTPPLEEQEAVLRTLRQERERVSKLIRATAESISRLHEFRSSLITAAVTGQIDVESWGKHGGTDRRLDQIEREMMQTEARA
ncbi:MAG: restriction endonuclease subunit S [Woeseia sp.]|nr:restriction endonuclease subunit S [Woeseia sp.]